MSVAYLLIYRSYIYNLDINYVKYIYTSMSLQEKIK